MLPVDVHRLALALAAMIAAAWLWDLGRSRLFAIPGEQDLRPSDRLLVNVLFFGFTPALLYAWFYPLVPFSGVRAGLFCAFTFFLLAVAPTFAVYRLQVPGRVPAALGHLFWLFLKYLVVYGLLTGIYRP